MATASPLARIASRIYNASVNRLRRAPLFVAAVIALTLVSWLAASNHCSLGGMSLLPAATHGKHTCCSQEKSASSSPLRYMECCEKLSAPLPAFAAAPHWQPLALHPAWIEAPVRISPALSSGSEAPVFFSTGPPGLSFAELVLQRSLPVHAPPVFIG